MPLRRKKNDLTNLDRFIDQNQEGIKAFLSFFKDKEAVAIENLFKSVVSIKNHLVTNYDLLKETNKNLESIDLSEIRKSINIIESLISLEKVTDPILARLNRIVQRNIKFNNRLTVNQDSKLLIKNSFLKVSKVKEAISSSKSVFFESGTTLAYAFLSILENGEIQNLRYTLEDEPVENLNVCTNNAIIHLITLFENNINPNLLPGKPTNQYCATFGDINNPNNCLKHKVRDFLNNNSVETIFSTASEFDIVYGPHVSSVPNCQLKQACNEYVSSTMGCQDIFVIASEKINSNIKNDDHPEDCKLVFGEAQKNANDYIESELQEVEEKFNSYLRESDVTIITGSIDSEVCNEAANKILKQYSFLKGTRTYVNPKDESEGCIFVINRRS